MRSEHKLKKDADNVVQIGTRDLKRISAERLLDAFLVADAMEDKSERKLAITEWFFLARQHGIRFNRSASCLPR